MQRRYVSRQTRRAVIAVTAAALLVGVGSPFAFGASRKDPKVRVLFNEETELDPCSLGEVVGIKTPWPKGFLAVRSTPAATGAQLDRLAQGFDVLVCDGKGDWVGIVYHASASFDRCNVDETKRPGPYVGPCRSGWVNKKFIRIIAG